MNSALHLTMLVGPTLPRPAPRAASEALSDAEVRSGTNEQGQSIDTFSLRFSLGRRSSLESTFILTGGAPINFLRVVLYVLVNGQAEILIDGVVTHHELSPQGAGGQSVLTVTGEDLTAV